MQTHTDSRKEELRASRKKKHRFHLKAGLSVFFFSAAVLITDAEFAIPCVLAAAFHELGHILAARCLRVPLSELKLDLFGAHISVVSNLLSYKEELLLCAAGPSFSFLLGAVLLAIDTNDSSLLLALRDATFFLGLLNLLPVRGFDGSRILSAILSVLFSPQAAEGADRFFTGIFLIFLWGISVYLLLVTGGGLALFVFSVGLFFKIFLS